MGAGCEVAVVCGQLRPSSREHLGRRLRKWDPRNQELDRIVEYRVNSLGDPDAGVLGGKGAALGLASPPPHTPTPAPYKGMNLPFGAPSLAEPGDP